MLLTLTIRCLVGHVHLQRQRRAQFRGVIRGQANFMIGAVQAEPHSLLRHFTIRVIC